MYIPASTSFLRRLVATLIGLLGTLLFSSDRISPLEFLRLQELPLVLRFDLPDRFCSLRVRLPIWKVAARGVRLRRGHRRAHGRRRESRSQPKLRVSAETTATESRID